MLFLVKFKEVYNHVDDLMKVFMRCMKYNLSINPLKCVFGVLSEKFLRFTVHKKGIDLDLAKPRPSKKWSLPRPVSILKAS